MIYGNKVKDKICSYCGKHLAEKPIANDKKSYLIVEYKYYCANKECLYYNKIIRE